MVVISMKNSLKLQNAIVLACAAGAALGVIYTSTNLLKSTSTTLQRERCYGIARAGQNDCATAQHACAAKATADNDPKEWIMVPKGLCQKITGGRQ